MWTFPENNRLVVGLRLHSDCFFSRHEMFVVFVTADKEFTDEKDILKIHWNSFYFIVTSITLRQLNWNCQQVNNK